MLTGLRNKLLGDRGEQAAEAALVASGVKILARQHRTAAGEIDLIGREEATGRVVFCEVKARTGTPGRTPRFGRPGAAVTPAKQRQLTKSGLCYLKAEGLLDSASCRFDVVEVLLPKGGGPPHVTHHPHAFEAVGVDSMFS